MLKKAVLAAAFALSATPLMASSTLYASDEGHIYTLNTSTGAASLVGSTGLGFDTNGNGSILRDLASSATTLYGAQWTSTAAGVTGAVLTIDHNSAAITSTANLTGLVETGFNRGLYSIAFDRSTNLLYGNTAQRLYTIDPTTGVATLVGLLPNGRLYGLAVDTVTNKLFAINNYFDNSGAQFTDLLTLDKLTAAVLTSVNIGNGCACDIAFDPTGNQGYISRSFSDTNGFLYAGLDSLDAGLASTTFIGQHGAAATFGVNGLAFLGAPVPEPSSWMMMIAGFGLIGAGMRRRKAIPAVA